MANQTIPFYHYECTDDAWLASLADKLSCVVEKVNEPFKNKFLKHLPQNELTLLFDDKGLWLAINHSESPNAKPQPMKMQANWLAQQQRVVSAGKKSELLLKAMKIAEGMHVIDATAGLGHDSILMAGRGAQVTMLEEQPIMFALLQDAMHQISTHKNWQKLHARLSLHHANAVSYMNAVGEKADVVYLDPMFPHDSYKSALVNKNMQILQQLAHPPTFEQEQALLTSALHAGKRVVVKRPNGAPFLAKTEPHTQWQGDVVRFDGYQN